MCRKVVQYECSSLPLPIDGARRFHFFYFTLLQCSPSFILIQRTQFGWVVFGAVPNHSSMRFQASKSLVNSLTYSDADSELVKSISKLWELQEPHQTDSSTHECETFFNSTVQRTTEGKYIVRIPLVKDPSVLGNSREQALAQFYRIEKRMHHNHDLKSKYIEFMEQYISHHAVLEKFRVVYNASAKTDTGVSLNDIQLVGPKIQPKLFHTLLRFRLFPIALTADIEKMFRQIFVNKEDLDLQRVFWRKSRDERVSEYQLLTVTYGMSCAPFNAIRAVQQCAHDHRKEFPLAAERVMNSFYVDDYLDGADTVEEASELKQQMENLLAKGGFPLRKWRSNNWNVISTIPEMNVGERVFEGEVVSSVLGIKWHVGTDSYRFVIPTKLAAIEPTKRAMLSELSRLFDPTGFLSPFTITGKALIQARKM